MDWSDIPAGVRAFVNPPASSECSYFDGSKIALAAVIVTLAIVPDGLAVWLLIPHKLWLLSPLLIVLEVYSALWLFGLYGSMVSRPHVIGDNGAVFNNGWLQTVQVPCSLIESAEAIGPLRRRELRRLDRAAAILAFGGTPVVRIRLLGVVSATGWYPTKTASLFVASNRPASLAERLNQACAASRVN
jgi:hypothetical protein